MKDITLVSSNPSITHTQNKVQQVRLETTTKESQCQCFIFVFIDK
jgi:hypothetical protein